jgi:hypothetical protein
MTTNLQKLEALLEELKPDLAAIAAADKIKGKVFDAIGDLTAKFDEDDSDDEEDIREQISDIAYSLDHSWNGNDEYESWGIGDRAVFWIPSTC